MFLIIGRAEDSFCQAIQSHLRAGNHECRIVGELFQVPASAAVGVSCHEVLAQCKDVNGDWLYENDFQGVYVRELVYPEASVWTAEDYRYVSQEITGAFLGWTAALPCPVLNRYEPRTWYMRFSSVLAWRMIARRCGLEVSDRAGEEIAPGGHPLRLYRAAVIGDDLVWDLFPPPDHDQLVSPLRRFMNLNSLSLLEAVFNFEQDHCCLYAIAFELSPWRFSPHARQEITSKLLALLTGGSATVNRAK
jgi:hypothetical protein